MSDCPCGAPPSDKDLAIEVQGVYDGVLIWRCAMCGQDRPAWGPPGRRHKTAMEIIDRWNANDDKHVLPPL